MTKKMTTRQSTSMHANKDWTIVNDGSRARIERAVDSVHPVSPASERIIKETSVKRRQAIEELANR